MTDNNRPVLGPQCPECEDWGTKVRPDGKGTEPCRNPIHRATATSPVIGPTAGDALDPDQPSDKHPKRG